MSLNNCKNCGKLFLQEGFLIDLCKECFDQRENEFRILRDHLNRYPGMPIPEVSERTGIPISKILSWVREGRIKQSN